jgi:NADPH-dependent curcumin reductase CurA
MGYQPIAEAVIFGTATSACSLRRIRYREDIVDDLGKAPETFIGMLDGHNFGKVIVQIAA